jgi:hypothetical protein
MLDQRESNEVGLIIIRIVGLRKRGAADGKSLGFWAELCTYPAVVQRLAAEVDGW